MEKKLEDKSLAQVCGGVDEIHVTIKTLDGEDDPYMIPLSNSTNKSDKE